MRRAFEVSTMRKLEILQATIAHTNKKKMMLSYLTELT